MPSNDKYDADPLQRINPVKSTKDVFSHFEITS